MRQLLVAGIVAALLVGCSSTMQTQVLTIGTGVITAEVVDTPSEMAQGLSGRASLPADQGMLFLYEQPTIPQFWMKDMHFSIDIVWLREGTVVGIEQRVPADGGVVRYAPPSEVDAVLELAAGTSQTLGLSPGATVRYER